MNVEKDDKTKARAKLDVDEHVCCHALVCREYDKCVDKAEEDDKIFLNMLLLVNENLKVLDGECEDADECEDLEKDHHRVASGKRVQSAVQLEDERED